MSFGSDLTFTTGSGAAESSKWTFRLHKLDGTAIGEVTNAKERSLSLALNGPSSASFTVQANHPLMPNLFGEDTLLQVWEGQTLRFYGFVILTELAGAPGEGLTINVNAVDPSWRLSRRVLDTNGLGYTLTGDWAHQAAYIIEVRLNRDAGDPGEYATNPDTRIRLAPPYDTGKEQGAGSWENCSASGSGTYVVEPFDNALKAITDLAQHLKGFDWRIVPLDNHEITEEEKERSGIDPTLPKMGEFVAEDGFGEKRDTYFEFGFGKNNIANLTYKRDLSDLTNKAFHVPDEGVKGSGGLSKNVLSEADVPSLEARGRWEEEASAPGLNASNMREAWLDEVIAVKKNGSYVVTADLAFDGPKIEDGFFLGDTVTIRGKIEGEALFSGEVRVYKIDINIDENGTEVITPTFLDEGGEVL